MTRKTLLPMGAAIALSCPAIHAQLVPTTVTASQDKNNYGGTLSDLISGEEMTKASANDPSTWTTTTGNYADGWNQQGLLTGAANNKIAWVVLDLGSTVAGLDDAYFWAWRHGSSASNNVDDYNIYLATAPTVAAPAATTTITDYDFASGGWTQLGSTLAMPNRGAAPASADQVVSLGGASARYIGIEILSNDGGNWVGFHEVAITSAAADTDPPTLASAGIVDDQGGAAVDVNTVVTYTLTFSEDINESTVDAADFSNAGSSAIAIGTITETSPGVFSIEVTPTSTGTLQLQVPASASIADVAGNPLDSDPAIVDEETLSVTTDSTAPTLADIDDGLGVGTIAIGTLVTYSVSFSEDMDEGTVSSDDFDNAGTSSITFGSIIETSPGVFSVEVTPTDEGTLQLRIPVGASMADTAGNPLDNDPAILDDATINVQVATSSLVSIVALTGSHGGDQYANGLDSLTNGSGIDQTVDPNDPSTWTFSGGGYQDEWMATYLKNSGVVTPGLNGKVAWTCLDFGSSQALGTLFLFNTNYSSGVSGADQFNIYHSNSPAVALPAKPTKGNSSSTGLTPQGDYDFSGGGWTLFNTSGPLSATQAGITEVDLPAVTARYLAIEILSNHGDSASGGRVGFDEISVTVAPPDFDNDGLPDAYEAANTASASITSLDPAIDLEPDGLITWQEYLLGTDPNDPDTDNDTLNDGPETLGVGSRPATNPLLADTDGDGLHDAVESNSGSFVDSSDTGTNPTLADTDGDGLKDNVETDTDIFAGLDDTGTSPFLSDSDSDGTGDWYEVATIDVDPSGPLPNTPNDSGLKPNIPYPLPDPDPLDTGVTNKPVKVYIMSGQSNMVGFGQINGTKPGTLLTITGAENKFPNLVASGGGWTTRNDVKYRGVVSDTGSGNLRPDVAGDSFGPELGFGYVMGWHHDEPVLLIKSSIGNRSLMWDYAPPTTPSYDYTDGFTYAGYGQSPNRWDTATGGPSPFIWYAGKQFDDCFVAEAEMGLEDWADGLDYQAGGNIGTQIRHNGVEYQCTVSHTSSPATEPGVGADWATVWKVFTIFNAADVLDNFTTDYSDWASQGYEIAGFVWWQGYSDRGEPAASRYQENMVRFIKQIRAYYEGRYPGKGAASAPFVLATLAADGGWNNTNPLAATIAQAQLNVDGDAGIYPEFDGNVKTMEARGFWRDVSESPNSQGFHYNWNAETYMLAGDALGRAMIDLQATIPPGQTYSEWVAGFPGVGTETGIDEDADGDGIDNGVENYFGTDPDIFSNGLVSGVVDSVEGTFTFTHPLNDNPASDITATYRWSKDLAAFHNNGDPAEGTTVTFSQDHPSEGMVTVTATVTGTSLDRLFVDIEVSN